MPFVSTPNGVEVTLKAVQNGVPIVNVWHVDVHEDPTPAILTAVADAFSEWWNTDIKPNTHPSYVVTGVFAKDISVVDGTEVEDASLAGIAGTGTGAAAAGQAAVVISWRTLQTGRSFRGRTYIGGLPNANLLNAQFISSASAAVYASAATDLIDALSALGYTLSVLSKVAGGIVRLFGVLTEIIGVVVDTKVDNQRRRTAN